MDWQIRQMAPGEVDRISEIDVSENGDVVYKWVDGRVQPVPEDIHMIMALEQSSNRKGRHP